MTNPTAGPATAGPTTDSAAAGRMTAVIARLAADDLTGRRVGTPGGRAAAAWLASHLESLGAQAYLDTFAIRGAVKELSATPVLRWNTDLVHRKDFAEHLASAHAPGFVTASLSTTDGPLAGTWVLESSFNAVRAKELARVGAAGILLPRGIDEAGWMPKMIAGPAACPLPVMSVRTDLFDQMTASVHSGQTSQVGASIPLQTVDVEATNVYGVFRTAKSGALSVLLTAHFDGVGDDPAGTRFPAARFPAAADNASGVAVILEAAQRLHVRLPPAIGLSVALLDGEEAGAHGSARHATQLAEGTVVINLDGAAQLHQAAAVEAGGPAHALLAALDQAGRQTGVPLRGQAMPSDNRRYAAAGFAAIGIGMGMPGYQTPAETPDRVEPATLLAAADLITAIVVHLTPPSTPRRLDGAP